MATNFLELAKTLKIFRSRVNFTPCMVVLTSIHILSTTVLIFSHNSLAKACTHYSRIQSSKDALLLEVEYTVVTLYNCF